jgi:AIPR protein
VAEIGALQTLLTQSGKEMDRITASLLAEFTAHFDLADLAEDKRFEHFAAYVTVRRHYSETFETLDVVIGAGADTGIDTIAIIANGVLVTDIDTFNELADATTSLDVTFIFVQAERTAGFDAQKIGNFGFGVQDFFSQTPKLSRNEDVESAAEIMSAIYACSSKFKRSRPACFLYYVTTGTWVGDQNLEARRAGVLTDLRATGLFGDVEFSAVGADALARFYSLTKNAISRTIQFSNRVELPEIEGVKEAFLGYVPIAEFLELVKSEEGEILRTIFYDNVRDWQEYNKVNDEIRETAISDKSARFVLMNNGITIIARDLQRVGAKFSIEDFQVVNGCQTSHVLFDQREVIDAKVTIPLRLIVTQDEAVIEDIIRATNRQTQLKEEQFISLMEFSAKLETFFERFRLRKGCTMNVALASTTDRTSRRQELSRYQILLDHLLRYIFWNRTELRVTFALCLNEWERIFSLRATSLSRITQLHSLTISLSTSSALSGLMQNTNPRDITC